MDIHTGALCAHLILKSVLDTGTWNTHTLSCVREVQPSQHGVRTLHNRLGLSCECFPVTGTRCPLYPGAPGLFAHGLSLIPGSHSHGEED